MAREEKKAEGAQAGGHIRILPQVPQSCEPQLRSADAPEAEERWELLPGYTLACTVSECER